MYPKRITIEMLFDHINDRFEDMRQEMFCIKYSLEKRIDGVVERLDRVEHRLDRVEYRLDGLHNGQQQLMKRRLAADDRVEVLEKDMKTVKKVVGV